jgi:hypothetical protein
MFAAMSDTPIPGETDEDRVPSSLGETGSMRSPRTGRPGTGSSGELKAALARIERRLATHEQIALRVIDMLAIHNEKLDAILEAATREPGPSPVAEVLAAILSSLREQEALLVELPGVLAEAIRDEWARALDAEDEPDGETDPSGTDPEMEPADSGRLDGQAVERH